MPIKNAAPGEAQTNDHDKNKDCKPKLEAGIATEMWLELKAPEPKPKLSLWLLVDNSWLRLDEPSPAIQQSVQAAFCACSDELEVVVWYERGQMNSGEGSAYSSPTDPSGRASGVPYGTEVKGLVIRSK